MRGDRERLSKGKFQGSGFVSELFLFVCLAFFFGDFQWKILFDFDVDGRVVPRF